jgi:hypothetical protein
MLVAEEISLSAILVKITYRVPQDFTIGNTSDSSREPGEDTAPCGRQGGRKQETKIQETPYRSVIVDHHVTNAFTSIEPNSRFRSRGSVGDIRALTRMSQYSIHSFLFYPFIIIPFLCLLSSQSFIFILFSSIT